MSESNHFYIRDFTKHRNLDGLSDKSLETLADSKAESTIDSYESTGMISVIGAAITNRAHFQPRQRR